MGIGLMTWGMRWDKDNAEAIMALAACTTPICGRTTGPNNVPHEPRQEYRSLTPVPTENSVALDSSALTIIAHRPPFPPDPGLAAQCGDRMRPFYGCSRRSSGGFWRLTRERRSGKFAVFGLSSPYNSLNAVIRKAFWARFAS
jgi:hypothetical protein